MSDKTASKRFGASGAVARPKVCANFQVFAPVRAAVEAPPAPSCRHVICHIRATVLKQTFLHLENEENLGIEKMLKLNSLPSFGYQVRCAHFITKPPRQKRLFEKTYLCRQLSRLIKFE